MGTRGPIPKPSAQRRRVNKPAGKTTMIEAVKCAVPAADKDWHPIAKMVYRSIKKSAEAAVLQSSDWATAYLLCESISRDMKKTIPLKGASIAAYLKGFGTLGMTEGDRRRMGIELQLPAAEEEVPDAANLDEHRRRLRSCQ